MDNHFIYPKNWTQFQHYKERKPPWIKLHEKILDDYEFHCLPVASRALAPLLWLLAREYDEGMIPYNLKAISFRMRMSEDELKKAITPLISSGFFTTSQDASTALSDCKHVVTVETETEAYKEEGESEKKPCSSSDERLEGFNLFWSAFNYKEGKKPALESWNKIKGYNADLLKSIIAGAEREAARRPDLISKGKTPKMAQGWLTECRWEDEHTTTEPQTPAGGVYIPKNDDERRTLAALKRYEEQAAL